MSEKVAVTALAGGGVTLATGGAVAPSLPAAGVAASGGPGKMELESQQQQGSGVSQEDLEGIKERVHQNERDMDQTTEKIGGGGSQSNTSSGPEAANSQQ